MVVAKTEQNEDDDASVHTNPSTPVRACANSMRTDPNTHTGMSITSQKL